MEVGARAAPRLRTAFLWSWAPLLVWWLTLFPGLTTTDSVYVWDEIVSGRWTSAHPPPYVALAWLVTRFGTSPALATMLQTLLVAWAMAWLVVVLSRRLDAGPWPLGAAVVMAALPWVGPFAVTVWKDIPTLALCLALMAAFVRAGDPREAVTRRWLVTVVGGLALGIALLRWNGFLTVAAAIVVAAIGLPRSVRGWGAGAGLAGAALGIGTLVMLPSLTPIPAPATVYTQAAVLADLASVAVRQPQVFDAADRAVLEKVAPFSSWQGRGTRCAWVNDVIFRLIVENHREPAVDADLADLTALWRRLVREHPLEVLHARACRAELAWSPVRLPGSDYANVTVVDQKRLTPDQDLLMGSVSSAAGLLVDASNREPLASLLWRPVLWTLVLLAVCLWGWRGLGWRPWVVAVAMPVGVVASYAATALSNDARYTFPAVVGLVLLTSAVAGRAVRSRSRAARRASAR